MELREEFVEQIEEVCPEIFNREFFVTSSLPYRPNVCMIVVNKHDLIFLGERIKRNGIGGIWQFPQGGTEEGISLEENVLRELNEELGAPKNQFQIIAKLKATHQYDFSDPPAYAIGRWRGQSQTFWLVRFFGGDEDLNLNAHEPEFSSFRWCTVEEVQKLAEPKRLPGYLQPLAEAEELLRKYQ